jgi:SPP1 gp7 family putative phage head morphogenesis protein
MPSFAVGTFEPKDAVAVYKARGDLLPSFNWYDVFQEEHSRGLAVAGVSRLDVLKVFQDELALTIKEGRSLADFEKRIQPQLAKAGFWGDVEVTDPATGDTRITTFDQARLRLIMDVNLRQSHAAGRWQRAQRTKKAFPYLVYLTAHDERVRHAHRQWDYLVLPIDDDFWKTHTPPNGWRCRCQFRAINDAGVEQLRAAGHPVKTDAPAIDLVPWVNPGTGEITPVPRGIDPGFAYNPATERDAGFFDAALRKAAASHPLAGAVAVAQATADHAGFVAQSTEQFGQWVGDVLQRGQAQGELRFVGAIKPAAVRALANAQINPPSAAIAVRDADVLHALRDAKGAAALAPDMYARLPELLARASAVLVQPGAVPPGLLYVVDLAQDNGQVAKVVVLIDYETKTGVDGKRRRIPLNLVHTVTLMDANALADRSTYQLVWGRL